MRSYEVDCLLDEAGEAGIGVVCGFPKTRQSGGCARPDLAQGPGGSLANHQMGRSGNGMGQGVHRRGSFGFESPQQSRCPVPDIG